MTKPSTTYKGCISCPRGVLLSSGNDKCDICLLDEEEKARRAAKKRIELKNGWYLLCTETLSMLGPQVDLYDPNDCLLLTGEMAEPELFAAAMQAEEGQA